MSTMSRVLPWRRNAEELSSDLRGLLDTYRTHHPSEPVDRISRAFRIANDAHEGQVRKSGEPYIHHPVAVATIVAEQGGDDVTVSAALVHDAVEDTAVTLEMLRDELGAEVASIVDGVTKLDRVKFDTKEHQQAATIRKMMVAVAKDLRVLIIKLADRLHNMRTIAALPDFKQERTSQETLEIYAPLAHRLGMGEVRQQLEDLAFAASFPKRYAEIDQMISVRDPERDLFLTQVIGDVQTRLSELGIGADVTGRPKHLYSIYEKMQVKGREFDEIFDLVGIRVIVDSVRDCYAALGCIHATWKPVQGRFKDYIAMPKFNLYQSLHTTVIGPQGRPVEVQIRTTEMHNRAEFGVAAHWDYKAKSPSEELAWLNRIAEWQHETEDPSAFMATLKVDLEQDDEVFVFTPKGLAKALPEGATAVDFAYAVHTEVGHQCTGAKVNGRLVPLDTKLESGDTVEISTSNVANAGPSLDWLQFVATQRAANKIKQWHSRERRVDTIDEGRDKLVDALRSTGLPVHKILRGEVLAEVSDAMNYVDLDSLFAAVGESHVSAKQVAGRVERALRTTLPDREENLAQPIGRRRRLAPGGTGVHVEGLDDVMVRLSKCCTPVPPDLIMGFVTRGRGVSVHRTDCANAQELASGHADRLIDVEWIEDHAGQFLTAIEIKALDRSRLLADITRVLSDNRLNILAAESQTGGDRVTRMRFELELGDVSQLQRVLSEVRDLDHVYDAYRVIPGKGA